MRFVEEVAARGAQPQRPAEQLQRVVVAALVGEL
jgi:hypothetical protein